MARRRPAAASRIVVAGLSCSATLLVAGRLGTPEADAHEQQPAVVVTVTPSAPGAPARATPARQPPARPNQAPATRSNGS